MTKSELQYADIINLNYTPSDRRAHMSKVDRAAQFSAFAALTGFDEQIDESARLTDQKTVPSAEVQASLNNTLMLLDRRIDARPEVRLIYFQPDKRKDGGAYREKRGRLKKIDPLSETVLFEDGISIPMEDIREIES